VTFVRHSALLLALLAAGCDKTSTEPSSTSTTTPTRITESFETTMSRGESMFYSFTVGSAGTVNVTLASVVQQGRTAALSTPLRIGLGTPEGEGCTVTDSVEATPALTPQLSVTMTAGIHCVSVADIGQTAGTVIAAVRFSHL
jgi:hypothetical protein